MTIYEAIRQLVNYGLDTGLVEKNDEIYTINRLLELFQLDEYEEPGTPDEKAELEDILKNMLDYAADQGILKENSIGYRDLFDTKIMGLLRGRPNEIISRFRVSAKAGRCMA